MNARIRSVLSALATVRPVRISDELSYLHPMIATALTNAGIVFRREVKLASRSRIDFLTDAGVGIEVKKRRPARSAALAQLRRYASADAVKAVVLVADRLPSIPERIEGKPVFGVSLQANWGIAV